MSRRQRLISQCMAARGYDDGFDPFWWLQFAFSQ